LISRHQDKRYTHQDDLRAGGGEECRGDICDGLLGCIAPSFLETFRWLVQLLHDYYAVQSLKPLKSDKQFSQYHDTQVTQKKFLFPLIFALKTLNKVAKVGVLQNTSTIFSQKP
jgi:hypothetical protein